MQRHTSIYLDLIRFSAAMVVFIGHSAGQRLSGGIGWQLVAYMDEAVVIFFVLSGYVIGHVTGSREVSAGDYAIARAARIYSVAVAAILATIVLDAMGSRLDPALYAGLDHYHADSSGLEFLGALVFVNYLWYGQHAVGTDLPYWSLCFEVWYYVIFGVVLFAPARWRWWATALLLLFVGPRIAGLFPLWLMGLLAHRVSVWGRVGPRLAGLCCWGSLALILLHQVSILRHGALPPVLEPVLALPNISNDYVTGALFAIHLVGFNAAGSRFGPLLARVARPIRWCAGATFTIYLFHMPLILFFATINPWPPASWTSRFAFFGGTLTVLFLIAELTERRKDAWRLAFERLMPGSRGMAGMARGVGGLAPPRTRL